MLMQRDSAVQLSHTTQILLYFAFKNKYVLNAL